MASAVNVKILKRHHKQSAGGIHFYRQFQYNNLPITATTFLFDHILHHVLKTGQLWRTQFNTPPKKAHVKLIPKKIRLNLFCRMYFLYFTIYLIAYCLLQTFVGKSTVSSFL